MARPTTGTDPNQEAVVTVRRPLSEQVTESLVAELRCRLTTREEDGVLWVITPYRLPNGDLIEIAIDPIDEKRFLVTDYGETGRFLANHGYDPLATPRGREILEALVARTGVENALPEVRKVTDLAGLAEAVFDVVAGCLALGDMLYLSRAYQPSSFKDRVGEIVRVAGIMAKEDVPVTGESGRTYRIHFTLYVPGVKRSGFLQTLSPRHPSGVKPMTDATLRMWVDLMDGHWLGTVVDDSLFSWPVEDLRILQRFSSVYAWSRREVLAQDLASVVATGEWPTTPGGGP